MNQRWHIPEATLAAYVAEDLSDVDSWSVEAHIVACADCRAALQRASTGTEIAAFVATVRERIEPDLPALARRRQHAAPHWLRKITMLVRGAPGTRTSWLFAMALVLGAATVLDTTLLGTWSGSMPIWWREHGSFLALIAPVLPVAGVALSYGPLVDPCHEMTGSTPLGGLRLLLLRTVLVLIAVVPTTLVLGMLTGRGTPVLMLLPGLALTTVTLALGSVIQLRHAAAVIGGGWLLACAAPLILQSVPSLIASPMPSVWLPVIAVSLATVLLRRRSFTYAPPLFRS